MSIATWYPIAETVSYTALGLAAVIHIVRKVLYRIARRYDKSGGEH